MKLIDRAPIYENDLTTRTWKDWFSSIWSFISSAACEQQETQIPAAAGYTYTIANNTNVFTILGAGAALATGTITMPAEPQDGQIVRLTATRTTTALTHNANTGQTLNGAIATLVANTFASWIFNKTNLTWYRIG